MNNAPLVDANGISNDEIANILKQEGALAAVGKLKPGEKKTFEFDIPQELAAEITATDQPVEEKKFEVQMPAALDPNNKVPDPLSVWRMLHPAPIGVVEVSWLEKNIFWKNMLHENGPLSWNINAAEGPEPVIITVESMGQRRMEIMDALIRRHEEKRSDHTPSALINRIQNWSISAQVLAVNGHKLETFTPLEGADRETNADLWDAHVAQYVTDLNPSRQLLFVRALQIFETKHVICMENLGNGNFWQPPVTS